MVEDVSLRAYNELANDDQRIEQEVDFSGERVLHDVVHFAEHAVVFLGEVDDVLQALGGILRNC